MECAEGLDDGTMEAFGVLRVRSCPATAASNPGKLAATNANAKLPLPIDHNLKST